MIATYKDHLLKQLTDIRAAGLYKSERIITTPQDAHIRVTQPAAGPNGEREVLNLCANNYLGLAEHPDVVAAAHTALDRWGYGLSSVRFICGTQQLHKQLEAKLSEFLGTEDTILYSSCFDANGGLFETLLGPEDAIISDELNHASIIDGVRLCKAQRYRYKNNDLADLEAKLKEASEKGVRFKMIATDGVFSMDGYIANLRGICDLADQYGALVMVDDSHAVRFIGRTGRGTHEHCDVMGRVDILTGTLGKALGGASGGYTSGARRSSNSSASALVLISFPTPSPRASPGPRSRCWTCSAPRPRCATNWRPIRATSAKQFPRSVTTSFPARIPLSPSCSAKRRSPSAWRKRCSPEGSTSSAFSIRSYRRARRASAHRSARPIRGKTWILP